MLVCLTRSTCDRFASRHGEKRGHVCKLGKSIVLAASPDDRQPFTQMGRPVQSSWLNTNPCEINFTPDTFRQFNQVRSP